MQITLNEAYLAQNINLLSTDSIQQLSEAQDRIEKFTEEKHSLQKKSAELKGENKRDVAFKIRGKQIGNEVVAILRTEALEQSPATKKSGIFAKLFRSAQVELEKGRFINTYSGQTSAEASG